MRRARSSLSHPVPVTAGGGGKEGNFCGLVGRHPAMLELYELIENISRLPSRAPVLLQGESGTGKELVARAVHRLSAGAGAPFVAVNCGAIPGNLLEDQLFGHVRGAFTGAEGSRRGFFLEAEGGTLFLDEITELARELQVKLLRAIQEREVYPVGADRPVRWHARLIVASNRDMEGEVRGGRFRQDLYHRINVIGLRIPPLRDRLEDIPILTEFFLDQFSGESGTRKAISAEALDLLGRHDYPGNVRELRNALERAHALSRTDTIEPADLPVSLRPAGEGGGFKPLAAVEREHILRALVMADGKKVRAAELLEIDRNRLYRLLRKHGIVT